MNDEYQARVQVLENGKFIGDFTRGDFAVNYSRGYFKIGNDIFGAANRLMSLVECLARAYPNMLSKEQIIIFIFGNNETKNAVNDLRVYISRLRGMLQSAESEYGVRCTWGFGYGFHKPRSNEHGRMD